MEIVNLNRIKAVPADSGKQGKWLTQQLAKTLRRPSSGVPILFNRIFWRFFILEKEGCRHFGL